MAWDKQTVQWINGISQLMKAVYLDLHIKIQDKLC